MIRPRSRTRSPAPSSAPAGALDGALFAGAALAALLVAACDAAPEQERVDVRSAHMSIAGTTYGSSDDGSGDTSADTSSSSSSWSSDDTSADTSSSSSSWSSGDTSADTSTSSSSSSSGDTGDTGDTSGTGDTGGGPPQAPPPHEAPGTCLYQGGNVHSRAQLIQKSCGAGHSCSGANDACSKGLSPKPYIFYRCGCTPTAADCTLDALPGWIEKLANPDYQTREAASAKIRTCCTDFAYKDALGAALVTNASAEARARLSVALGQCSGKLNPCGGKVIAFNGGYCTYSAMATDPQPVYDTQKTFCSFKNGAWMIQAAVNCGPPAQGTLRPDYSSTSLGPNNCAMQAARPANASPWAPGGGFDLILPDRERFYIYYDAPVPNVAVQDENVVPPMCNNPQQLYAEVTNPVAAAGPLCPGVLFSVPLAADICTDVPNAQAGTPSFPEDQPYVGGLKPGDGD